MRTDTPEREQADVGSVQQTHEEGDYDEHNNRSLESLRQTGFAHMGHQTARVERETGKVADGPARVPNVRSCLVDKLVDRIFRRRWRVV